MDVPLCLHNLQLSSGIAKMRPCPALLLSTYHKLSGQGNIPQRLQFSCNSTQPGLLHKPPRHQLSFYPRQKLPPRKSFCAPATRATVRRDTLTVDSAAYAYTRNLE